MPIYVAESVLDQAGMRLDNEGEEGEEEQTLIEGSETELSETGPAADDERLSIFRQFIETLDMDDLGKGKEGREGPSETK